MATIKFSDFSAGGSGDAGTTQLAGYKTGDTSANYRYSISDLSTMLGLTTLYADDGTIGTTRIAKVTDTLTFQNLAGTATLFTLNDNGTFTLGEGATAGNKAAVGIGDGATAAANGISIGVSSSSVGNAVALGGFATVAGALGVAIGYGADCAGDHSISIGHYLNPTGDNSITFNATGTTEVQPATQYACGFYMTDKTTPDFEVVGGGTSTLNTNLKITGQAYSELNDIGDETGATWDIDWNDSNIQAITLNNGGAMTLNTPTNPQTGATYILKLIQGASPSTVTWTASIFKWPAGAAPVLSLVAAEVDIITLIYDGTNYYGTSVLNFS